MKAYNEEGVMAAIAQNQFHLSIPVSNPTFFNKNVLNNFNTE